MRKVFIQPQARADLLDIWNYISERSPSAANTVAQKLEDEIGELALMPGKGHKRAEVRQPPYRFWRVYSYIIAYRYDDASFTVVRVLHGRRSFRGLFGHQP